MGDAQILDNAYIGGRAIIEGSTRISGNAVVAGDAHIRSPLDILCGVAGKYNWSLYRCKDVDADRVYWALRFGCTRLTIAEWRDRLADLCVRYVFDTAAWHMRVIEGILHLAPTDPD